MSKKISKKGRGGRKPGTWTQVKPDQILAHRKEQKLSRAAFATALGVSSTTIQNWESNRVVATQKTQARIVELLRTRVSLPKASLSGGNSQQHPGGYDSTVEATGRIVAALLGTAKIKPQELRAVIQDVKSALA